MNVEFERVFIIGQWVSWSSRKNLSFNWRLVMGSASVLNFDFVRGQAAPASASEPQMWRSCFACQLASRFVDLPVHFALSSCRWRRCDFAGLKGSIEPAVGASDGNVSGWITTLCCGGGGTRWYECKNVHHQGTDTCKRS